MDVKNKKAGFTLIELIFVIAIIGITITLGISYLEKLAERTKEKTTSIQIQQILQAAMTYYAKNESWPSSGGTNNPGNFRSYIAAIIDRSTTNPWGVGVYSWNSQSSGGKLFTVSTDVPNTNTATRIMSLLPNAYNNNATVSAQIAIPGKSSGHGYFLRAGTIAAADLSDDDCTGTNGDCRKEGYISVIASGDSDAVSCIQKGGFIKVMPYISQFTLHGHIEVGMTFGDGNTRIELNENISDDKKQCGKDKYCVHYVIHGRRYVLNYYIYPDAVIAAYVVLCMPIETK